VYAAGEAGDDHARGECSVSGPACTTVAAQEALESLAAADAALANSGTFEDFLEPAAK